MAIGSPVMMSWTKATKAGALRRSPNGQCQMKPEHVERFVGHLDAATDEILLCQRPTHRLHFRPDAERLIDPSRVVLFGLRPAAMLGRRALDHDADGPKYVDASSIASPIEHPRLPPR